MIRFAAADPQVTRVLQDIIQSLRGLERRLGALEGRLGLAPAPDEGVMVAASMSASGTERKKRRKKKKGKATTTNRFIGPQPSPPLGQWCPKRARDPRAVTPRETVSERKGANTPRRVAPTPSAVEWTPAKTASTGAAGVSSVKKKKKAGKGAGVITPTPVRGATAARAQSP